MLIGTCATGIGCNCPAPPTETCYGNEIAYKTCIYGSTPTTTTVAGQCLGFCNYAWNGTGWTAGVNTCGTGCGCNNPPTDVGGYIGQNVVTGCSTNPSTSSTTSSSTTSSTTTSTTPCPGSCNYQYISGVWVFISSDCSEECPCAGGPTGPPDLGTFISVPCGNITPVTTTSTTPGVCGANMCRYVWEGSLELGRWVSITACPPPCFCSYPTSTATALDQIYEAPCKESQPPTCSGACLYQWSGSAWSLISSMDCVTGCYCHPPQGAGTTSGEYASTVCSYSSTTTTAAPTTTTTAAPTTTTTTGTGTTATTPAPTSTTPNGNYLCSRLACCFTVEEHNVTYAKSDCGQGACNCYPGWMIIDVTIDTSFYANLYYSYRGIVGYNGRNKSYVYQSCEQNIVNYWGTTSSTSSSPPFDPQCGSITCQWQWHSANSTWTRYAGEGVAMNQYCRCEYPPVSGSVDNEIYSNPAVSASCGSCMQGADKFQWYFIGDDPSDPFVRAPQELTVTFHDPNGVWPAIDGTSLTLYRDNGNMKQFANWRTDPVTGLQTWYSPENLTYPALTYQTVKRTLGSNGGSAVKVPSLNGTGNFIPIFDSRVTADQRNQFVGKVTCPPCNADIDMKKLLKATTNFNELICKDIYFDFRATIALGKFIKYTGAAGIGNWPCSNCFEYSSIIRDQYIKYSQGLNTIEPTKSMLIDTGNPWYDAYNRNWTSTMEDKYYGEIYPYNLLYTGYWALNAFRQHAKTLCTNCASMGRDKAKFNVQCSYGTFTGDRIPSVYDWQWNEAWKKETPLRKVCSLRMYNEYKDKMTDFPDNTRTMYDFDSFSPIQMSGELKVKKLFWDIANSYINGWWGTSYYNEIFASILWDCGADGDGVITYTITE